MDQTKTLSTKFRYRDVFIRGDESDPKIWGKKMWKRMFDFAARYPRINPTEFQKNEAYKYYQNLQLPCIQCQNSYDLYWNQVPIEDYLSSRKFLIEWVYVIKRKVNFKLAMQERNNEAAYTEKCLSEDPSKIDFCVEYGKKKQAFRTKKSPPFSTILDQYYNIYK